MGHREPGGMAAARGLDKLAYAIARLVDDRAASIIAASTTGNHIILHEVDGQLFQYAPSAGMSWSGTPLPGPLDSDGGTPLHTDWYTWPDNVPVSNPYTQTPAPEPDEA
jgi:hypothetical protein